jgi:ATP-dependent Clp protease ATP-binding subunit ClpA
MRFDKFTIKSQELIQNAQSLAASKNHQQIEPEHLLAAMLSETDGIASTILRKLGVSPGEVLQKTGAALSKHPQRCSWIFGDRSGSPIPTLKKNTRPSKKFSRDLTEWPAAAGWIR